MEHTRTIAENMYLRFFLIKYAFSYNWSNIDRQGDMDYIV